MAAETSAGVPAPHADWVSDILGITLGASAASPGGKRAAVAEARRSFAGYESQVDEIVAATPEVRPVLRNRLGAARSAIKSNDAAATRASMQGLRQAIQQAAPARKPTPPGLAFKAGRLHWDGLRRALAENLAALEAAINAAYVQEPNAGEMAASAAKLRGITAVLGEGLGDRLDACIVADPASLPAAAREAIKLLAGYVAFIEGNPVMQQLSTNPFLRVPVRPLREAAYNLLTVLRDQVGQRS